MDSLKIPKRSRELVHDCENCQALCCVCLKLDSDKFPILEDKKAGIPCQNLDLIADSRNLFKCKIHDQLKTDWKICSGYSCNGAGQEVSRFFSELGFSLAPENPEKTSKLLYNIRKKNLEAAFVVLRDLFELLKSIKNTYGAIAFAVAKKSIELEMEEFSLYLERTDRSMYVEERNKWLRKFATKITYTLKKIKIDIEHLIVDLFS